MRNITALFSLMFLLTACAKFGCHLRLDFLGGNEAGCPQSCDKSTPECEKDKYKDIPVVSHSKDTTHELFFMTSDGYPLYGQYWGDEEKAHYIVVAVHGFGSSSETFKPLASLLPSDTLLVAYDQRAHGLSATASNLGVLPKEEVLEKDLKEVIEKVSSRYQKPIYLYGQSMGSAVATLTLNAYPQLPVRGFIIAPPSWQNAENDSSFFKNVVTEKLNLLAKNHPACRIDAEDINKGIVEESYYNSIAGNPLNSIAFRPRADYSKGVYDLSVKASDAVRSLPYPMLVLFGDRDMLARPLSTQKVLNDLKKKDDFQFKCYTGGRHILYLSTPTIQRDYINDISTWIKNPTAKLTGTGQDSVACLESAVKNLKDNDAKQELKIEAQGRNTTSYKIKKAVGDLSDICQ